MPIGSLSRWVAACAAVLLTAPVAAACEDPDDNVFALREELPVTIEPGEVILEVNLASMRTIEWAPNVISVEGYNSSTGKREPVSLTFSNTYAVFDVTRAISGDFNDEQVTIRLGVTTCWGLGGPSANYLVGRPITDDAFAYFAVRPMTMHEVKAHWAQDQKAPH